MKYFVVADVHGYFDELMTALNAVGFDRDNHEHLFVSLGDLLDRGRQPKECLEFVNSLERKILIRGNHEDLLEDMLNRMYPTFSDKHNGTYQTVVDLVVDKNNPFYAILSYKPLYKYLSGLDNYYETSTAIFVHGWIPCEQRYQIFDTKDERHTYTPINDWREAHYSDWSQSRWINGMDAWASDIKEKDKTIYCGHWHCSWGHSVLEGKGSQFKDDADFSPFIADGICALDACAVLSHKINCVVLEE